MQTRTHARTHARMHACTRARARAHTHTHTRAPSTHQQTRQHSICFGGRGSSRWHPLPPPLLPVLICLAGFSLRIIPLAPLILRHPATAKIRLCVSTLSKHNHARTRSVLPHHYACTLPLIRRSFALKIFSTLERQQTAAEQPVAFPQRHTHTQTHTHKHTRTKSASMPRRTDTLIS